MCNQKKLWCSLVVTLPVLFLLACGPQDGGTNLKNSNTKITQDNEGLLKAKVIYGKDDRLDLHQVKDQGLRKLADSTVALIKSRDLSKNGNYVNLPVNNFKDAYGLCDSEPFGEQPTAAFCSGFLVDEETIVTAGHCIDASDCNGTSFVFNYAINNPGVMPYRVKASDVYNCKKVVHSQDSDADYAVIKLDRKVLNHGFVKLRRQGAPKKGTPLVVVGHPVGLPTKVASGAEVRSVNADYMIANLDTYGGNSGSAVFNTKTHEVEGILVRGEYDFDYQGSCTVSHKCANTGCRGEDVTRISRVLPHLNQ